MTVPVLLVAGFLGAGKTTVVNRLLAEAGGLRIAAVVNDFGAINIDAELIAGAAEGVVSLANGCICCTLEGDLLRTLAGLLRREPRPEAIVIETSGVAEPAEIVRTLMDPVVWREAPLETVLCVVDAGGTLDDPLVRAQIGAADVVAVSKGDLAGPEAVAAAGAAVRAMRPGVLVVEAERGAVPLGVLFPDAAVRGAREVAPGRRGPVAERFEALGWSSAHALSLPRLQRAIGRLAPRLARAKGVFESGGRRMVLQLAGGRASLAERTGGAAGARMVFIAEVGRVSREEIAREMGEAEEK